MSSSHKGKGSTSQQTLRAGLCDLMSLYGKPRHFREKKILVAAYFFGWALMSRLKFARKTSKVCKSSAAGGLWWELILGWYHMEAAVAEEELPTLHFPLGPATLLRAWVWEQGMDIVPLWLSTRGSFKDGYGFVRWCRTVFHNHIVWGQRAERNFKTKFLLPRDSVSL